MAWGRIDDTAHAHQKFLSLDPAAIGLWAMGLSYCAGQLTDGFIPRPQVPRLVAVPPARAFKLAEVLVKAGLWETRPDGYQVHDFGDWNDSASDIRRKRQQARERQDRYRESKTGRFGNASRGASNDASPNSSGDGLRDALVTSTHATPRSNTPPTPPSGQTRHSVSILPGGGLDLPPEASAWIHEDGCPRTEHLDRFPAAHRRQCPAHRGVVEAKA